MIFIGSRETGSPPHLRSDRFGKPRRMWDVSPTTSDPARHSDNVRVACCFLAADSVGLSRAPTGSTNSHGGAGEEIEPYHTNAISMLFNQGHETMEGGSERRRLDVVAQSMRAYLRFSVHGGVIAEHVRRLGCSARVQTDLEGDVLQPPLLTLAGLGEVSRIGDVILDPCLGPRRNSGAMRPGSNCPFQESESSSRPSPRGPPRCGRDNRYAG